MDAQIWVKILNIGTRIIESDPDVARVARIYNLQSKIVAHLAHADPYDVSPITISFMMSKS